MSRSQRTGRLGRPPKLGARQTRDAILDTALELFAAQGFAGTSLRQIAHAIGISESAIYAHFESKRFTRPCSSRLARRPPLCWISSRRVEMRWEKQTRR